MGGTCQSNSAGDGLKASCEDSKLTLFIYDQDTTCKFNPSSVYHDPERAGECFALPYSGVSIKFVCATASEVPTATIVGAVLGAVAALALLVGIFIWRKGRGASSDGQQMLQIETPRPESSEKQGP